MKLTSVNAGFFKLDGGAMFGVVPKSIWNKLNPADEKNLCTWALRCLLVEDGDRKILIDTGMGMKQIEKFSSFYQPTGNTDIRMALNEQGVGVNDITDVILTHLHFDHCGGAVSIIDNKPTITFPNATYWSNEEHWKWANYPNAREKASFLTENMLPIEESGQLAFIQEGKSPFINIELRFVNGHTKAQMLPIINYYGQEIAYVADLIPSVGHMKIPYVMSYDVNPLQSLEEKTVFLEAAYNTSTLLFFEHDPSVECASLKQSEKGVMIDQKGTLSDMITN